jgi:hypothetical protein
MRIIMATVIGVTAASAGFGAGLVGTIAVSPWTGSGVPAINVGWAVGALAMMSSFVAAVRRLKSQE